jgi:hypothetical protein
VFETLGTIFFTAMQQILNTFCPDTGPSPTFEEI